MPRLRRLRRERTINLRELGILAPYLRYKGSQRLLTRMLGAMTREIRLFNKNLGECKAETLSILAYFCPVPVPETRVQSDEGLVNGGPNSEALKVA